jgi:hypothetical protein
MTCFQKYPFRCLSGLLLLFSPLVLAALGWLLIVAVMLAVSEIPRAVMRWHRRQRIKEYRAAIARGDAISAELSKVQQKLKRTEYEYLTYANAITGVCSPDFRVFVEYASGAKEPVPAAPSTPPDPAAAEAPTDPARDQAITRAIAANVAINYARLDACVAGYNALIDWHQPKEAVNE